MVLSFRSPKLVLDADVRVLVWWDFKSFAVPDDVDTLKVAPAIAQAVRANGIKGPIHITAFGNLYGFLMVHSSTFIGRKNCDSRIIMWQWYKLLKGENLIGKHFNHILLMVHMVLGMETLGCHLKTHSCQALENVEIYEPSLDLKLGEGMFLFSPRRQTWQWYKLLKGENLIGKHFNHPPDGPYGSWMRVVKVRKDTQLRSSGNDQIAVDDIGTANYESGNFRATDKCVNPTRKEVDDVCHSPYAFQVDDSLVDKKTGGSDETYRKGPTFFGWIRSRWQFWKGNAKSGDSTAHQNKVVNRFEDSNSSELVDQTVQTVSDFEDKSSELDQNAICSGKPELFSSSSFWNDMESFIFTLRGSLIVSQSKNREDMAHKLQKDGAPVFRSLPEKDILQLLELLISEKKWLEESPTQTFPFQLTQPVHKNSLMGQSHGANGLRSLFLSRESQSSTQKSSEHNVEKHNQSIPCTRVSATTTETKYTERSRNDILEDCQKLVRY
ncbi:hypothetical protein D0Y65_010453 [Glycine soja]|uniref:Uncharacterized protein n=1 Tax=Glycine soja TaxID=3848 RepID=A0A445L3G7_GLYSO|nr:hypothetical protein D0Y65_010453 [Glycine soja]